MRAVLLPSLLSVLALAGCPTPPPEVENTADAATVDDGGLPDASSTEDAGITSNRPDGGVTDGSAAEDARVIITGTDGGAFDDFTDPDIVDTEHFRALATEGPGSLGVKYIISNFTLLNTRDIRFMDGAQYELHDQWYWFRLMNGQRAPGADTLPYPGSFPSVQAIVQWAHAQAALPLDLRFIGERLYSPRFYDLALNVTPQVYGVGTVVHFPARETPTPRAELWAFELEYTDVVTPADLAVHFQMLESSLPQEIGPAVRWLVRSPVQEGVARTMEAQHAAYHDRILRYSDLTTPGEVQVYSQGLTAGRLRKVTADSPELQSTRSTDILLMDAAPDFLPQAAGLVTAVPQTPLAHVNVLARNRGIPNAYLGGVMDDANLDQMARVNAPVAIRALLPNVLQIVPLTDTQYAQYRNLFVVAPLSVPPVDLTNAPYTTDLSQVALADVDELRPLIGGKCAGMVALLAPEDVSTVHRPLCITVKAYAEHIQPMVAEIQALLAHEEFNRSLRARTLALEGPDAFDARFPQPGDQAYRESVMARPTGDVVADMARAGGLVGRIQDAPINTATLAILEQALGTAYDVYQTQQALRFRSSSSVEDIEGFNGAGLYTSNTGFLHADLQSDPSDRKKTVERAIKLTWSSYWGTEAFEERRLESVDHLSGNIAVMVHARFDDAKELANGVLTFTILPPGHDALAVMELNAQAGALSVANPERPGVLPEVVRVTKALDGTLRVERLQSSTEVAPGEEVVDDTGLLGLFTQAHAVTQQWLENDNQALYPSQRRRTLTLDFEFKDVDAGWPALAGANQYGRRMVLKQARTLEPGTAHMPEVVRNLPLPRDVLARARRIERRICTADRIRVTLTDAYTDKLMTPDLGFDVEPFTGVVMVEATQAVSEMGWAAGYRTTLAHTSFSSILHPGMREGGAWAFDALVLPAVVSTARFQRLQIQADKTWTLSNGSRNAVGTWGTCQRQILYSTPTEFLLQFFGE